MARGWFPLDHELLKQALSLPDDAEIVAVEYIGRITCAVWVEHDDIPEPKDNVPHKLMPVFKRVDNITVQMVEWSEEVPLATLDVMEHNQKQDSADIKDMEAAIDDYYKGDAVDGDKVLRRWGL